MQATVGTAAKIRGALLFCDCRVLLSGATRLAKNMGAKYILFFVVLSNFSNLCLTYEHQIFISNSTGRNTPDCVTNSNLTCQTLDYAFGKIANVSEPDYVNLRNSTKIQVQGNQLLLENYTLTGLDNFVLSGNRSVIKCESHRGLIILSSKDIVIEHVTFLNCGSEQKSQNKANISFHAGLFFSSITNLNVNDCVIINSTGIGMALLDVGGYVMFTHTHFTGNRKNSRNGSQVLHGLAQVGGGLIIEFTYNNTENVQSSSNNSYVFYKCNFTYNGCTWNTKQETEPEEADRNNVIFGCGGGLAMTFKGNAQGNFVFLDHCIFKNNLADWGGGYYFLFEEKTVQNVVKLRNVTAESNYGIFSGGGGRFYFDPCFNYSEVMKVMPNWFEQENCSYYNNSAGWGGGVSVFGSSGKEKNPKIDRNMVFVNSHWIHNQAVVGSALGFLATSIEHRNKFVENECNGLPYTVELQSCVFRDNKITSKMGESEQSVVGTGTLYVDVASIVLKNVSFFSNNGTALVLDLSNVYIFGNVSFYDNSGNEGGAVALYGRSRIVLGENSSLMFTSNTAALRGGAIYAYSQGPNLKAFKSHLLDRSTCFFSYINPSALPGSWLAEVTFMNNSAPGKSGRSVYCDTLQFCRNYGNLAEALQWNHVFHYDNSTDGEPNIVTDPVVMSTLNSNWIGFAGQHISPNITLLDEKNQATNGLLKMTLNDQDVKLAKHVSEYIYISDGKSSVPVSFNSKKETGDFKLTLSSVYTQVIKTTVDNITTTACYGGYKFDLKQQRCVCLPQADMPYGYRRCGRDGERIYIKIGYWATIGKDNQLILLPCPLDYCKCYKEANETAYGLNECELTKFSGNANQCADNREGRLCGSCKEGYTVVVGLNACRMCPSNIGLLWLLLILFVLTIVVFLIIYFEIDFFSGPLNSWLYTYHIIHLLPDKSLYLDPFIIFVVSLTYGNADISTGRCFWMKMDALQKLALQYVMPVYCILLLLIINQLLRCYPNFALANRSFHRAFVTIVIISYASLVQTTFAILHPVHVDYGWFVFVQADVKYFSTEHLPYAMMALVSVVVVVLFPCVIAFSSYFITRFRWLRNFIPLFDAIQSPYRPNRRWFASYYIFCRLIFTIMVVFRNNYEHTLFPFFEGFCVIILLLFVLLEPYNNENHTYFYVDTCFLSLLCLIICVMNAKEVNVNELTVYGFQFLARILMYIPLMYSVVLFIRYVYRRVQVYRQARGAPLV